MRTAEGRKDLAISARGISWRNGQRETHKAKKRNAYCSAPHRHSQLIDFSDGILHLTNILKFLPFSQLLQEPVVKRAGF